MNVQKFEELILKWTHSDSHCEKIAVDANTEYVIIGTGNHQEPASQKTKNPITKSNLYPVIIFAHRYIENHQIITCSFLKDQME